MWQPETIDAQWMTTTLHTAGATNGATVTDVQFQGLIGTGQMGRNARFSLTWDDPDGRPASVVAKFPTADPVVRATSFEGDAYRKEWMFYSQLQQTSDIRTPLCYAALWDDEVPDFVIVMEDLAGSRQGDQFVGLTVDEAALGVEQAAGLHASHWGDDGLMTLLGATTEDVALRLSEIYLMTLEGTLARLGPNLDDESLRVARDLAPLVGRWVWGSDTPSTLAHMDFRPDNFMFATSAGAPPLVVVDWQTYSYRQGTNDVAYMIGGGFEPAERAKVERDLVRDYCDRLRGAGIDYDHTRCWHDYCVNSVWGVIMSVIATMLAQATERGDAMLTTMLTRAAHHAIDVDALALLKRIEDR